MNNDDLAEMLSQFSAEELFLAADAEECEQSLTTYLERAWPSFDPSPFSTNWHIDAVCLPADAAIATTAGNLPIGSIVTDRWDGQVLSFNHQTQTVETKSILAWMKSPGRPMLDIALRNGKTLTVTGNHPVFTQEDGYVRADHLYPGQTVLDLQPLRENVSPQPIPSARWPLQHALFRRGKEKARGADLSEVRWSKGMGRKDLSDLLGGISAQGQAFAMPTMWNPSLRHSWQVEALFAKTRSILRSLVSRKIYGRSKQSGIYPRAKSWAVRGSLSPNSTADFKARRESLLSVLCDWQDGRPPYRLGQRQQRDMESRDLMPTVPHSPAWDGGADYSVVETTVSSVAPSARIPGAVFNIEVEGNNNYFAEGVLVHNCEHLEAVSHGEIRRLLINIPPRHTKTATVAVAFPTWTWANKRNSRYPLLGPQVRFLCTSYGAEKAQEDGVTARRLIGSEWWQKRWGKHCVIASDRDNAERYDTEAGGSRISTGLGGALLGRGGDVKIIDDPIKTGDANSSVELNNVIRAFDEMFSTRATDPKITAEITIMQRLSELDLSGHILSKNYPDLVHLCIPAEYEWDRHCTTFIGWSDPRGTDEDGDPLPDAERQLQDGTPIWPTRFGAAELAPFKVQPYVWAGQYQQRPEPRGGGIIKPEWWRQWPPEGEKFDARGKPLRPLKYPEMEYIVAYLDTALTTKTENDPSGMQVWGVWRGNDTTMFGAREGEEGHTFRTDVTGDRLQEKADETAIFSAAPRLMLMEAWDAHLSFHDLVEKVLATCRRRRIDKLIIEGKANGHSVHQEIMRLCRGEEFGVSIDALKRAGDKDSRLHAVAHLFTAGLIYTPTRNWSQKVKDQCSAGSKGAHDEHADCASGSLRHLRGINLVQTQKEYEDDVRSSFSYKEPEHPYSDIDI